MNYEGKELKEFRSDKNIAFNPPKLMLVWCDGMNQPLRQYVAAFCPNRLRTTILNEGGTYEHCAEILEAKTNWDVYSERHGTPTISLEEAIETFDDYNIPCTFCPARKFCASTRIAYSCTETFKTWANAESKEEKDDTAGNV